MAPLGDVSSAFSLVTAVTPLPSSGRVSGVLVLSSSKELVSTSLTLQDVTGTDTTNTVKPVLNQLTTNPRL